MTDGLRGYYSRVILAALATVATMIRAGPAALDDLLLQRPMRAVEADGRIVRGDPPLFREHLQRKPVEIDLRDGGSELGLQCRHEAAHAGANLLEELRIHRKDDRGLLG